MIAMPAPTSRSGRHLVLPPLLVFTFLCQAAGVQIVPVVHVGALVAYDSSIGRVAKRAIEMAVSDINKNGSVLPSSKLALHMLDTNCSAFQGAVQAIELLKKDVVAVIGPQSSAVSHFVGHIGTATQVPYLSYAATDPALSEFQYPYIFRIAHTDAVQMEAIASLVGFYGWREVVALYTDDDFGSNGAAALSDALVAVGARIVQKAAFAPDITHLTIGSILTELIAMQTRIFVVHMPQDMALMLFAEAKYLGMISAGYVWIISDAFAGTLKAVDIVGDSFGALQGIIGTRGYYQQSSLQLKSFLARWESYSLRRLPIHLYGLYAYDAVWFLAHALDAYLQQGRHIVFKNMAPFPSTDIKNTSDLAQLKVFEGGQSLRTQLLQTKFQGTSGLIQVNSKGDLIRSEFEIVNIVGQELRSVGYWSNYTQLSLSSLESPPSASSEPLVSVEASHISFQVIWPGNITETPRGWVLPKNGRPLRIAVPLKAGFKEFVALSGTSSTGFNGFCIDVFQRTLKYLPYSVPYMFVPFGKNNTPVYDEMIDQLAHKVYDAVVGDVTITTKRMEKVDFSQPYIESGLVVVVPLKNIHSINPWAFLRPFTARMWFTTLSFFIFTGLVMWMLEHKLNKDFRGHPKKQVVTICWFIFSTLFFSQREQTRSACGKFVIIVWLFVVLIITSSYTANLTSILTVQKLMPTIQGISSLQANNDPIGYQTGSFVKDYLISINIAKERLKPLSNMAEFEKALKLGPDGGVAAIVEEVPYVQEFLSSRCEFTIVGQEFTRGGWGYAFPKDSELAVDMSTAILSMSESGELQKINDLWLSSNPCDSTGSQVESNKLDLGSFWGLFLITGMVSILSVLVYMVRLLWRFLRQGRADSSSDIRSNLWSITNFIRSFTSFVAASHANSSDKRVTAGHGSNKGKEKEEKMADCVTQNDAELLQIEDRDGS